MDEKRFYMPEEFTEYAEAYIELWEIAELVKRDLNIPGCAGDYELQGRVYNKLSRAVNLFMESVPKNLREQEPIKRRIRDITSLLPKSFVSQEVTDALHPISHVFMTHNP